MRIGEGEVVPRGGISADGQAARGRFRNVCYHARHAGDPQGYAADEANSVEDRVLELNTGQDGNLFIRSRLDSAGGAVLRTALEPLAMRSGADDDRHQDRRMADALVELAGHGLDSGAIPQRASQRAHLQVTASLDTVMGISRGRCGRDGVLAPDLIPHGRADRLRRHHHPGPIGPRLGGGRRG